MGSNFILLFCALPDWCLRSRILINNLIVKQIRRERWRNVRGKCHSKSRQFKTFSPSFSWQSLWNLSDGHFLGVLLGLWECNAICYQRCCGSAGRHTSIHGEFQSLCVARTLTNVMNSKLHFRNFKIHFSIYSAFTHMQNNGIFLFLF